MKIKTGDYVEVLPGGGNAGIEDGEQGVVIDGDDQEELKVIFPASTDDTWNVDDDGGWWTISDKVKLIYRHK